MAKSKDNVALKKGRAQFEIVGEAKVSDYTFKLENNYDSGWKDNQMNLGVDCGNGNVVYCDLTGGFFDDADKDSVLYVRGFKEKDGKKREDWDNRFEIDWDDRFNEDIQETVADSCFIRVGLEKDAKGKTFTKRFLSGYDAVEYIKEHLEDGMVLNIRGNLSYSGIENTYQKKEITSIYLSKATPDKYHATFTQTVLLTYDSIGKFDKEKYTFPIDAYVVDYVGKVKGKNGKIDVKTNIAFPKAMEFLVPEGKEENIAKLIKKYFKVAKKDGINELMVFGDFIEGAQIVNVDWDDVPEDIKELVDMGVLTEDEAKAKSAVGGGSRERRMVIRRPEVTYTGEDENRKATVLMDEKKYTLDDLVFISKFVDTDDKEDTSDTKTSKDIDSPIIDEDDDIMAMLGELDD